MTENKMHTYLGDGYSNDDHISNFLKYWLKDPRGEGEDPDTWRRRTDLDCLYFDGNLQADTLFSAWMPMKWALESMHKGKKFHKDRDMLKILLKEREKYFSESPLTEHLNKALAYVERRENYILLPDRRMNCDRFSCVVNGKEECYYDEVPVMLTKIFDSDSLGKYFADVSEVRRWITDQCLRCFFIKGDMEPDLVKPMVRGHRASEVIWPETEEEVIDVLCYMIDRLEQRRKCMERNYLMELKDLLSMPDQYICDYDFTEDWSKFRKANTDEAKAALKQYSEMEPLCRFFTKKVEGFRIPDPDSESKIIQDIYKKLWSDKSLELCKKDNGDICGETMNSVTTIMSCFYKVKKSYEKCAEYVSNKQDDYNDKELENYIKSYHTIGNFIPCPVGCNGPRGMGSLEDYWDLTLACIWNYYHKNQDQDKIKDYQISDIAGTNVKLQERYKKWLDSFGSWDEFIKQNYMQSFVDEKSGKPRELWAGHFSSNPLPPDDKQCREFFLTAAVAIRKRGTTMIGELRAMEKNNDRQKPTDEQHNQSPDASIDTV